MKFLRNPEIKKCLFLQLLVSLIFSVIGFYFDTICGVIILFASLIFILIFMIFTRKRYRKVESLSQQLDAMLHSNSSDSKWVFSIKAERSSAIFSSAVMLFKIPFIWTRQAFGA